MRSESIALNYAEALFALGEKSGKTAEYAQLLDALAGAVAASPRVQAVLMSPKVTKAAKSAVLTDAMAGAPKEFLLFLQSVVKRGRQGLLGEIAGQFVGLLDVNRGGYADAAASSSNALVRVGGQKNLAKGSAF
ncbi:MAG TPA: F0F1 ATP synthase subunit delta, partial [Gemmatimonadales bacterium]|nr:F0F1 ATP synthase subunit delta [Gemmatimonadales bacterium]